ncbi:ornithine cyclodeaminase family protein [Pseudomaricurvus alkylphenolicus]|uniref:ornithine cyclodeaminase family protein n=1 Tax=Pseudomaricurvus alkylphenolicus TaxID=1306991 RepID=UPI001423EC51|nr:ornithine cyclodeaminase family protein [Pseudomaricurvus alkylphenolicus]NIB38319.1 ornithine cyclodeaminase family protein [Pseudomaricurvus alkylphenolicus]
MLILNDKQVKELLTESLCRETMASVMKAVSKGEAIQPMRQMIRQPSGPGMMGWMPGYIGPQEKGAPGALGMKLMSIFPQVGAQGRSHHRGVCTLFNHDTGEVDALIEAGSITSIRTPCATAVATQALARTDSNTLAILGTGEQASGHLSALLDLFLFDRVLVWGHSKGSSERFAAHWSDLKGVRIETATSVEQAVAEADIVCTTTAAAEPILRYEWLKSGAHVNVIGSSVPFTSEIDIDLVSRSRFFVDHRETVQVQGGDYRRALEAGAIDNSHIEAEVGEVLLGQHSGRTSDQEITVYKSVGLVGYDLAAAQAVYNEARNKQLGQIISLVNE